MCLQAIALKPSLLWSFRNLIDLLLTGKDVKAGILTGTSRELQCISMKFTSNARRKEGKKKIWSEVSMLSVKTKTGRALLAAWRSIGCKGDGPFYQLSIVADRAIWLVIAARLRVCEERDEEQHQRSLQLVLCQIPGKSSADTWGCQGTWTVLHGDSSGVCVANRDRQALSSISTARWRIQKVSAFIPHYCSDPGLSVQVRRGLNSPEI